MPAQSEGRCGFGTWCTEAAYGRSGGSVRERLPFLRRSQMPVAGTMSLLCHLGISCAACQTYSPPLVTEPLTY